ncbi:MAG TPA: tRNA (adenosine(37)-N6)-threonylcarbamoyltransferase complex dimerization subunit type 1 TsaB [Micropepsaceae bacterium]|nr:tRNA (adenosine(37)-N6)-threonylcarbamoyltransferase complex dimerization subunit type 1 TsaB [Micropepsaceae bacterium]
MRVLGLDTALGALSVAVVEDGRVLVAAFEEMVRGQAELLAPMVARVLQDAGIDCAALDRIAVTTGPGTFTGQRVGLAFARGLALSRGVPCVGVTTLHAMAHEAHARHGEAAIHVAASDARRSEAYAQMFAAHGEDISAMSAPVLFSHDALIARVRELLTAHRVVVSGTASAFIAAALGDVPGLAVSGITQPHARHVALIGAALDPATSPPLPLYLREADAKLPGPPKPLPAKPSPARRRS